MVGDHGEQTEWICPKQRFSSTSRRRDILTHDRRRVTTESFRPLQSRDLRYRCVISTLCVPNLEYQLINPTTQVALFALCLGNCTLPRNLTWNIYRGENNASQNITQWTLFTPTNLSVFGRSMLFTDLRDGRSLCFHLQVRRQRISRRRRISFFRVLRSRCGDSKWFILSRADEVLVH